MHTARSVFFFIKTMSSPMAGHETQEIKSCFVVPSEKTPEKVLWLSPLDIVLANRGGLTPLVHFYRRDDAAAAVADGFFEVGRLKEALAKALVAFYPFAGRFRVGGDGRPEIDCNAEGVFFVVARSELAVDDALSDLEPSPELKRLFIPRTEPPSAVLAVQVTFLRCGGMALGTAMHHAVVDGHSMFHFLQTWAAFCRDGDAAVVELPCHDRALLRARSRLAIHPDAPSVFCPKLNLREPSGGLISAKFFAISKDQLATLKRICGGASTFSAVTALVWQCACVARRLPPCSQTRVRFPVNIRRRMKPPLPDRYFGNVVVEVFAAAAVEDIVSGSLAAVAARINGVTGRLSDDGELLRSAIDYNEMAGMPDRPDNGNLAEAELRVVSWLGIPLYDVDFGWGKPRAMSRAGLSHAGFFYVMDGGSADGDGNGGAAVRVFMCVEAANVEEFERWLRAKFAYARI